MVVAPQGSPPRTVSASGQAFYDAQGVKLGAVVSMHDITARKQAEAALRASEERNRLALQAARMGTWDWDVLGDVQTWSVEAEALAGLAPGTFEGTFAGFKRTIHPDDWMALEQERAAAVDERREAVSIYRTVWPDGSVHWLEGKGRLLFDDDGTLVRVTGTTMDVTERKLTEAALRASEERFRKQYKGFPLPTYSWLQVGDDFVLQDFNDAAEALTNGQIRQGIGQAASSWYADQPEILADLHACVAEQRTIKRKMSYRFRTTRLERDLAVTYVFVPPQTVMVHSEDITERN
jgi:PAS domain S-box-containing protein